VQKRIYQSLGGTREYNREIWDKFGDKVGWRKKNEWLHYNYLTFSERAPEAHLPGLRGSGGWSGWWHCDCDLLYLFSRVETCKVIVPSPELTVPSPDRNRRATPEPKLAPPETTPMVRTIDQLWVKYSNGRFGFSVQKRIYQSLGGTSKYDEKVWDKFGDKVGWRKNNKWLYYYDLSFLEKAPEAHLPGLVWVWWDLLGGGGYCFVTYNVVEVGGGVSLLSRRDL